MEITYKTLGKVWQSSRLSDSGLDFCDGYGEPGYGSSTTAGVLLANWWCNCGRLTREDGTRELHDYATHYPRFFAALEEQGYELAWSDEWVVDHESSKCYRTTGDCYQWQSSILWSEDGDFLTPDNALEDWIAEVVDDPARCLPSNVWSAGDLREAGFVQWVPGDEQRYESGWHSGQTDDPAAITSEIRETAGYADAEIVFLLDEASQFYIGFSAWTRGADVVHFHSGHNIPGYLPMDDGPAFPMTWETARDSLLEDLDREADHCAAMMDDDPERAASMLASIAEAEQEIRASGVGEDIYVNVCSDDAHDLGVSYWVTACQEDCSEDDDA